ncbi:MAG: beta-ketoacyl-[acyl-carrier-protein] synthase family protein [Planctomycetes bacterium]|nr:beta-ketoacyl-[acyl-carrier-protein] synthase family protein [Planctomycetota bacterium]
MSASPRRVVVTGLGMVTPIGIGVTPFWDSLHHGRGGIRAIRAFDVSNLPTRIAGEVEGFDAKKFVDKKDRKSLRVMSRPIQLAVAAAQLALDDANVNKESLDPTRFGCEFGAGLLPTEPEELGPASLVSTNCAPGQVDMKAWGDKGLEAVPPLWMLKYLPNMLACHVSILHNAQGPNNSITESDAAGLLALGEAARILRRNQADFFLVGGGDSKINPISLTRHCLFGLMSRHNDDPERACRPFDRRRDGWVIGEGAGVLTVEDLEHAKRRGAAIYAEVVGFGAAFDKARKGDGIVRAIKSAMTQANIGASDLDHVNAHGLSTVDADIWEAAGLRGYFGDRKVPVLAVKSYLGSVGAASGIIELAASILALKHGVVPRSLNFEEPDPAGPVSVLCEPKRVEKPYFLKISFTDMGQCAAVVCRRWE